MERQVVQYAVAERVATVTLDRPERLNAWTGKMSTQYRAALLQAAEDREVRVIVVTGAGRGFCAGADTEALAQHSERGSYDSGVAEDAAAPGYGVRREFDAELAYHFGIPKPIIAAINGPAAGYGFALACYCDLRMAARGAKLTSAHGRLGLPVELGLSWLLPRLIGLTRATDLLLSSRIFLAEEGREMGLLNSVHDQGELMSAVAAYAGYMASEVSPASMAVSKAQLYRDILGGDPASSVTDALSTMNEMMAGEDYREGVAAIRAKRSPRFGSTP